MRQPPRNPKRQARPRRKVGRRVPLLQSETGHNQNANATPTEIRALFLEAYEKTCGNVSASCEYVGIDRRTYYRWMESNDPDNLRFQQAIKRIRPDERLLDIAEASLIDRIRQGSDHCITFALKTKGKARGYGDRPDAVDIEKQRIDEQIAMIKSAIGRRAQQKSIEFKIELKNFLELFGQDIQPEIRERLIAELDT